MTTAPSSPVVDPDSTPAASAKLPQTSWRSQPTHSTSSDSSSGGQQPGPSPAVQPAKPILKPATLPPPAVKESPNASIPPPQRPPGYLITSTPRPPTRVPQPTAATGATPKQPRDERRFSSPILPPAPRQRPPLPVTYPTRHPGIADKLPIGNRKRPPRVTPHTTFQEPPRSKPRQPKNCLLYTSPSPRD